MSEGQEQRERIREIALAEFAEKGFAGASLGSIASRAGCTKQNVIYHFGTKQGLLESACQRVDEAAAQLISDFTEGRSTDLARAIVDIVHANPYAVAALLFYNRALPDQYIVGNILRLIDIAAEQFAPGDPTGQIRVTVALSGIAYVLVANALSAEDDLVQRGPVAQISPELAVELLHSMTHTPEVALEK